MPSASRARRLSSAAWPSMRDSHTGWSGTAADSSRWCGKSFTAQSFWSQPRPRIQVPGAAAAAAAATRSTTSA